MSFLMQCLSFIIEVMDMQGLGLLVSFPKLMENRSLHYVINIAKPWSHHCSLKVSITKWQHTSLLPRDIFFPVTEPTTAAARYYHKRKVCSW